MTIDDKIKDEKLQYDINREAAKILALFSWKIDKYEYFIGEEILPPKFTYSSLGKAFEKQIKTIKDQEEKQTKAVRKNGKQLVESNELIKKDFNIDKDSVPLEEQKEMFNELVNERSSEFVNFRKNN